jgi:hypothetical protein
VIVRGLFGWKLICAGLLLFIYICIAVEDLMIRNGGLESQ